MMLCAMMLRDCRRATSKRSVSRVKLPASGVDNAASPDWQTPLNGIISPSERGLSLCKNNWKEPRSILMSSADRVAHNMAPMQLLWACYHALPVEYKCLKSNKTEQSIYECLLSRRINIFCAATNFKLHRQFLLPNQKRRNDGDGFLWCYFAAGLFWTVNVCWAHPVISRATVWCSIFFMVLFPMLFEVGESYV